MANTQKNVKSGNTKSEIAPAKGKLGVMIPGMGAVATTFVAGVASHFRWLRQMGMPST